MMLRSGEYKPIVASPFGDALSLGLRHAAVAMRITLKPTLPSARYRLQRRQALKHLGALVVAPWLSSLGACSSGSPESANEPDGGGTRSDSGRDLPPRDVTDGGSRDDAGQALDGSMAPLRDSGVVGECRLYPQQTQGPFYFDPQLVRRDIREGKPGTELRIRIRVVNAADCAPITSAIVDVWQADADGRYSGYPNQLGGVDTTGQTFLRGLAQCDAEGVAELVSIYPGWYPGRTTHVHLKVHLDERTVVTSQAYFPEDITTAVYANAPYAVRGAKDTSNADEGLTTPADAVIFDVTPDGDGYSAGLTVAVL